MSNFFKTLLAGKWGDNKYVDCMGRVLTGFIFLVVSIYVGSMIPYAVSKHYTMAVIVGSLYSLVMLSGAVIVFNYEYRYWKRKTK